MPNLCELPHSVIQADLNLKQCTLTSIANGNSKKVYAVTADNHPKTILYIWQKPFSGLTEAHTVGLHYLYAEGLDYFCHNTRLLTDMGIRVPRIIKTGHYSADQQFDYAYVECFDGVSLQDFLPDGNVKDIIGKLAAELNKFYACRRDYYGPPLLVSTYSKACHQLCYEHAVEELEIACSLDKEANRIKNLVLQQLNRFMVILACPVRPPWYTLIHGEVTPAHVWLLADGTIGFIDIEGIKLFDIEFEYALLDMLYDYLRACKPGKYDGNKVLFYKLYHRICWLSIAVDYLRNIDAANTFFTRLRRIVLRDLSGSGRQ